MRHEIDLVLTPPVGRLGAVLKRIAIPSPCLMMKMMEVLLLHRILPVVVVVTKTVVVTAGDPPHPPTIDLVL